MCGYCYMMHMAAGGGREATSLVCEKYKRVDQTVKGNYKQDYANKMVLQRGKPPDHQPGPGPETLLSDMS